MIHEHKPETENDRQHAKRIYWVAWIAAAALLFVLPFFVLPSAWLLNWLLVFSGFLFWSIEWIAGKACQAAGVSQEGRTHGIIRRDARAALVPFLGVPPEFKIRSSFELGARVDRDGIEARDVSGRRKRVAWREVEACTFCGIRDAKGDYKTTVFMLQGSQELPLLQFMPTAAQAEKLLAATRFYLRGESEESNPPAAAPYRPSS